MSNYLENVTAKMNAQKVERDNGSDQEVFNTDLSFLTIFAGFYRDELIEKQSTDKIKKCHVHREIQSSSTLRVDLAISAERRNQRIG